jgi:hypothetical protein
MNNRYLEKIASFEKKAFDTDYESKDEYGIAANRSIGNNMVHDMLMKASKDPNVHVMVDDTSSWHDRPKFEKHMAEIKAKIPAGDAASHTKNGTMQWHRDHVWSMGMKKDNKILNKYIGKEDRWGDEMDNKSAILHHMSSKHNY